MSLVSSSTANKGGRKPFSMESTREIYVYSVFLHWSAELKQAEARRNRGKPQLHLKPRGS